VEAVNVDPGSDNAIAGIVWDIGWIWTGAIGKVRRRG
jgi:hypothetical protein